MFESVAPSFMPSASVPIDLCPGIEDVDIDGKVDGIFTFEVVRKDEYGIEVKIKSMSLNPKKRII